MTDYTVQNQPALYDGLFIYHPPHGDQARRYEYVRSAARELMHDLCEACPPSAELQQAILHLRSAVFWANAAIASNEVEKPFAAASGPRAYQP